MPLTVAMLSNLEERLVSLRLAFGQIRYQSHKRPQYTLKGAIINVPTNIDIIQQALPRYPEETKTISMALKCRLEYIKAYHSGNVRPIITMAALKQLCATTLYLMHEIKLNHDWDQTLSTTTNFETINNEEHEHIPSENSSSDDEIDNDNAHDTLIHGFIDSSTIHYLKDKIINITPSEGFTPLGDVNLLLEHVRKVVDKVIIFSKDVDKVVLNIYTPYTTTQEIVKRAIGFLIKMSGEREEETIYNANEKSKEIEEKEEDTGAQVAPIVKLEEVAVTTGEENEDVLLDMKSKLYRFDKEGNQWKERGAGTVKFLKHKETGKVRLVMRQAKTLKICVNHSVQSPMALQEHAGSDKTWVWHAPDFSDGELKEELFCIRLPTVENAKKFKDLFEEIAESQSKKSEEEEKSVDSAAELLGGLKVEDKTEELRAQNQDQDKQVDEKENPTEPAEAKQEA
ncbi:hypothetical protein KI387_001107 [Taxus chinensis]|uniref:RanBD1 domain-containing protein n=1 Tax=Taxus chinensis TaxID=29808 RepID=A0AA38LMB5_TAXCH|nr:hypothetical protein KI387_001107 [Taxus chinensis]